MNGESHIGQTHLKMTTIAVANYLKHHLQHLQKAPWASAFITDFPALDKTHPARTLSLSCPCLIGWYKHCHRRCQKLSSLPNQCALQGFILVHFSRFFVIIDFQPEIWVKMPFPPSPPQPESLTAVPIKESLPCNKCSHKHSTGKWYEQGWSYH